MDTNNLDKAKKIIRDWMDDKQKLIDASEVLLSYDYNRAQHEYLRDTINRAEDDLIKLVRILDLIK